MEEKQYQEAKKTSVIEDKLEEHIKYENTVTKELQDKLEVVQTYQNELGKAETDDKKALERKFVEIQASLKKEEANIVERSRELNLQCNTSLTRFETQLELLKRKCESLEKMKDEVYMISLKVLITSNFYCLSPVIFFNTKCRTLPLN